MNNGIGRIWAVNAEGGDEGRPNGVGPVYIENIDKLGSQLPEPEAADAGKVLGVLNSDGDIGWVPDQEGMAQVQSDWDQTDPSQVSYIANKPSNLVQDADYVHTDNNFTDAEKSKLGGIESGAQVNVKPDWNAAAGSAAEILNKPTIPTVDQNYNASSSNAQSGTAVASAVSGAVSGINQVPASTSTDSGKVLKVNAQGVAEWGTDEGTTYTAGNGLSLNGTEFSVDTSVVATQNDLSDYQPVISDLETIRSGASAGATAVQPGSLATVATTGSYDDLLNKPTIPPGVVVDQVYDSDSTNAQSGVAVASAISGKQDTLTAGSNVSISSNVISATDTTYSAGTGMTLTGTTFSVDKPVPSTTSSDNGKVLGVTDSSGTLGWVSQAPGVTVDQSYNASSTNAQSGTAVADAISTKQDTISDLNTIRSGAQAGATAVQPADLPATKPLVAGTNVTITENANNVTISATDTDTTYSAGTGLALTGTTFSVSNPVPSYNTSTDSGKVLSVGTNGTEWAAPASSTVSTDGVISGNGSVASPIELNYGSSLAAQSTGGVSNVLTMTNQTWNAVAEYLVLNWYGQTGDSNVESILTGNTPLYLSISFPNGVTIQNKSRSQLPCYMYINPQDAPEPVGIYKYLGESDANGMIELDLSALDLSTFTGYSDFKQPDASYYTKWVINFSSTPNSNTASYTALTGASPATTNVTFGEFVAGPTNLEVANPVPTYSTSTDSGKVLSVGSNGLEWDAVPSELPTVTGNARKVLTVNIGATGVEWADIPTELPDVSGKATKVLTVNSGATGVEWANVPSELPSVTSNAGKVLTVNSGATGVEWTNFTQIEVVASMPASPTSGVLYIVTGA